jgi:hypothetical protein
LKDKLSFTVTKSLVIPADRPRIQSKSKSKSRGRGKLKLLSRLSVNDEINHNPGENQLAEVTSNLDGPDEQVQEKTITELQLIQGRDFAQKKITRTETEEIIGINSNDFAKKLVDEALGLLNEEVLETQRNLENDGNMDCHQSEKKNSTCQN